MKTKRFISVLLTLVMILSMVPTATLHVHAWDDEADCEYCGAHLGDDWICSGGDHCSDCEECFDEEDLCEGCGYVCPDCCVDRGTHCPECGKCQDDATLCEECGRCEDCGGWCENCQLCFECAADSGSVPPLVS